MSTTIEELVDRRVRALMIPLLKRLDVLENRTGITKEKYESMSAWEKAGCDSEEDYEMMDGDLVGWR